MGIAYFDSSVVLAVLLQESKAQEARQLWDSESQRVSSVMLEAECLIVLRRFAARAGEKIPTGWLDERFSILNHITSEFTAKNVDAEILGLIRSEKRLAGSRTLDAIHLATALYFRDKSDEFVLVSFDQSMRETAAKLKLAVLP